MALIILWMAFSINFSLGLLRTNVLEAGAIYVSFHVLPFSSVRIMIAMILISGKDKLVVLWSIHDHISTSVTDPASTKSPGTPSGGSILKQTSKTSGSSDKVADGPSIGPRGVYQGHEDTVEDVQFCPSRY